MSSNCQIPTPIEYVHKLLNAIGYKHGIFGKRILENSCGEGQVLSEIVNRYILDGIEQKKCLQEISEGLANDIIGYEIDKKCISICHYKLDEIAKKYRIEGVKWNLINKDYLETKCEPVDYVVGNPPYITYHDLSDSKREKLRAEFVSCKQGRFDYYYAFVEKSLRDLKNGGKLAYLIPFNIYRNNSAKALRKLILSYLTEVYDYSEINIFPGIIISSTIIVCDKTNVFDYVLYSKEKEIYQKKIRKSTLDDKWIFQHCIAKKNQFGEFFAVSNSVATLLNEAFLLPDNLKEDKVFYYVDSYKIEKEMVKKAVSPRCIKQQKKRKIIFPYKNGNGIERISEEELCNQYPGVKEYLNVYKEKLDKRHSSSNTKWFEYGRSQALKDIHEEKIILPMIMTEKMNVALVEKDTVPYAGYYIIKKQDKSLELAKKILESNDFTEYVKRCGTPTTSNSYRISVKDIEAFTFSVSDYI